MLVISLIKDTQGRLISDEMIKVSEKAGFYTLLSAWKIPVNVDVTLLIDVL